MPEWEPDTSITAPDWLRPGVRVSHTTFGLGTVGRVADYNEIPTVWIDFDSGDTKALALEFALGHLELAS